MICTCFDLGVWDGSFSFHESQTPISCFSIICTNSSRSCCLTSVANFAAVLPAGTSFRIAVMWLLTFWDDFVQLRSIYRARKFVWSGLLGLRKTIQRISPSLFLALAFRALLNWNFFNISHLLSIVDLHCPTYINAFAVENTKWVCHLVQSPAPHSQISHPSFPSRVSSRSFLGGSKSVMTLVRMQNG